ncbi:lysophospholipid acyltransferase family protein [Sphingomonas bacterium]|uniref:lysophospholipid acyltransferase family protein n=1 Tax=Sphingomonas bacterium TaxID=1895847 RepID=UPI0020C5B71C|nr:lysophospholipid acyltransferase family protein [Sphingomonas bacterium]
MSLVARGRMVARLGALLALLLICVPLHYGWLVVGLRSPWPRRFLGAVARIVGARARIVGTPLPRDVVFVSNHLSWIDIMLIAGATGSAFVAKAELARTPLVGWLCRLNDTIFVDRADRMRISEQVGRLRAALATGRAVTVFPEGTTGDGVSLLPFKAGMFAALDPPPQDVLVQPIRLDYGAATRELAWTGAEGGTSHARRVLRRRGSFVATLRLLDPFDPAAAGGRKGIAAEARRRMED